MATKYEVLSPFQEFKDSKVGTDLDFLVIPDAPFRFSFAGVERSAAGAVTVEVLVERIGTTEAFRHAIASLSADPSWFFPGPVGYVKIPRGYGIRVTTSGIAGGETVNARVVIEKLVDY
jgi:hypothetical protein